MRSSSSRALWAGALLIAWTSLAQAQEPAPEVDFEQHYQRGEGLYEAGHYREAAEELQTAYRIRQVPALLVNIGQAYRKAGYPQQALEMYGAYLKAEPTPPPERKAEVEGYVRAAQEAIGAQRRMRVPVPAPVVLGGKQEGTPVRREERPVYRHAWFWAFIGTATAATVAGVAVAATYPRRPDLPGELIDLTFMGLRF